MPAHAAEQVVADLAQACAAQGGLAKELEQARAQVKEATARAERAEGHLKEVVADLAQARAAQGELAKELEQVRAQVKEATARAEKAEGHLERLRRIGDPAYMYTRERQLRMVLESEKWALKDELAKLRNRRRVLP